MPYNESDTRAKLIDPTIHGCGWSEDLIRREETAGAVEVVEGRPRRRAKGRVDYILRIKVNMEAQPVAVALIEAKAENLPPGHGLEQVKVYGSAKRMNVPFVFSSNGHLFVEYDIFVKSDFSKLVLSDKSLRLVLNTDVALPEFVLLCLRLKQARSFIEANATGASSSMRNLSQDKIQGIPLLLPALETQKRIVAMLHEQMGATAQMNALISEQRASLTHLLTSSMKELFSRYGIHAAPRIPFNEIAEIVGTLVDPTLQDYRNLPHINGENIQSGTGRLYGVRSAAQDRMTSPKFLFEEGDVLYSKLRPYLRKVTIAPFRGLCSADMYPLRINADRAEPGYVATMLLSTDFSAYAEAESRRARMPKLNRDQLFAWKIPLLDLTSQRDFLAAVRSARRCVEETQSAMEQQALAIEDLPAALLRRAFSRAG